MQGPLISKRCYCYLFRSTKLLTNLHVLALYGPKFYICSEDFSHEDMLKQIQSELTFNKNLTRWFHNISSTFTNNELIIHIFLTNQLNFPSKSRNWAVRSVHALSSIQLGQNGRFPLSLATTVLSKRMWSQAQQMKNI